MPMFLLLFEARSVQPYQNTIFEFYSSSISIPVHHGKGNFIKHDQTL